MKNTLHMFQSIAVAMAAVVLSGCVTTYEDRARHDVQRQSEADRMEEKNRQFQGRVEGVEMQLEDVQRELRELRRETADSGQASSLATSARLDALEAKLAAMEANRAQDRQEIIDRLTEKITTIMNARPSAASASRTPRPRPASTSEYGYEHQVQPGETLSQIAAAYGVSMQSIIDANAIQNPNSLNVGAKLFVPE